MAGCTACGRAKARAHSSQASAAHRASAALPPGSSAKNPVIVGGDEGDSVHVRVAGEYPGLSLRKSAWVRGTGVPALVEDGTFEPIGNRAQRRRMWKVGNFKFLDEGDAHAAAKMLKLVAVEIA